MDSSRTNDQQKAVVPLTAVRKRVYGEFYELTEVTICA